MVDDIEKEVGFQVSSIRRSKGFSQIELAEKCNLNFNYISRIELGNANFTLKTLKKIAQALDVSVRDFFKR